MDLCKRTLSVSRVARCCLGTASAGAWLLLAAACTDVNVLPSDGTAAGPDAAGGDTATPGNPPVDTPVGAGGTGPTVEPSAGGDTAGPANPPVTPPADETIGVELGGEHEGYEEVEELIGAVSALDANNHFDQNVITSWFAGGATPTEMQQVTLFDVGDELSELDFTNEDGVGALLGPNGAAILRFNRVPQDGRFTGPNASACIACHDQPLGNGAGLANDNVLQDPLPANQTVFFNERNSRNVNGGAWLQQLAIEMTIELQTAAETARTTGVGTAVPLVAKGVDFGALTCAAGPPVTCDYSGVVGVSPDLVVRPFGWKGNVPTMRFFVEDAFNGELGMQSDRIAYAGNNAGALVDNLAAQTGIDNDGDGVEHEISVGDVTALTFYFNAQARPVTIMELAADPAYEITNPEALDMAAITSGQGLFTTMGCDGCHVGTLNVTDPIVRDPDPRVLTMFPTAPGNPGAVYVDMALANTQNGYSIDSPVILDLGNDTVTLERNIAVAAGVYPVGLFSDLKRHNLGSHLCDPEDSVANDGSFNAIVAPSDSMDPALNVLIDACEFVTAPLWGIGGTAPYMHDGRSVTISDAIAEHCSADASGEPEGTASCMAFMTAAPADQAALLAFLHAQTFAPEPE